MEPLIIVLGLGLFAIFIGLLLFLMARVSHESALLETVTKPAFRPLDTSEDTSQRLGALLDKLTRPLTAIRATIMAEPNARVVQRLGQAGYRRSSHVDLYLTSRLVVPVVAGLVVAYIVPENSAFFFIIAVVLGFFAPDFWLTEAVNRRRAKIDRSLPDGLDLMAICMEAGLGLDQSIVRVGHELRHTHPDLSMELLQINFEQRAGVPRIESWKSLSDRLKVENLTSFVAMLIQTERFGTPVAQALNTFSDSLRISRKQKAEELAAKSAIKLLFPLILFIFPLVFLVTVGPAVISLLKSLEDLAK